jgi:hypothetical protein
MTGKPIEPEAWLSQEDSVCREGRIVRLEWLASMLSTADYLTFPGGLMSKFLFDEMRYCFVYGQFLATIMLGLAYIERTLAADFFAAGRDDLEQTGIAWLLREARHSGILSNDEADELDRIRCTRNPVTHFRRPGADDSVESRSLQGNEHPYELLERDAQAVVRAAMKPLRKHTV